MCEAADEWLFREAIDLLAVECVGIYELLWLVKGSEFHLDDETAKFSVRNIVGRLLSEGKASLILLRWPTNEVVDAAPEGIDLEGDTIFEPDRSGAYLALGANVAE